MPPKGWLKQQDIDKDFWSRVDKSKGPDACWPWIGALQTYGVFYFMGNTVKAHRVAFMVATGEHLEDGEFVLHRCDNPPCCNPRHLFKGTTLDNVRDKINKGRAPTGDRNGSRTHPERLRRGVNHPMRLKPELTRGTANGRAILTEAQVLTIYAQRGKTHETILAKEYGVSASAIRAIFFKRSWTYLLDSIDN